MKARLTFIGMQETFDPLTVFPLFNDENRNTMTLATAIDRFGDFGITNSQEFVDALAAQRDAVFNSILVAASMQVRARNVYKTHN